MVKPALPYLDVIQDCATLQPDIPTACYQVSGEYAMIYAGAKAGVYDLRQMAEETVGSMIRAGEYTMGQLHVSKRSLTAIALPGASIILTYFTPQFLDWLESEPLPH
jgi:porphobilinogen synthase